MTALLEQAQALRDEAEQDRSAGITQAKARYRELLRRADAPKPGDAESLHQVTEDLGISTADIVVHLDVIKHITRIKVKHDRTSDAHAELVRTREALAEVRARHKEEIQGATLANTRATTDHRACSLAIAEATTLARTNPLLFAPLTAGQFPAFVGEQPKS